MTTSGYTGRSAYIAFCGTELQPYYRTAAIPTQSIGLVSQISGDDTVETWLTTDKDGNQTLECVMPSGTAGTAFYNATLEGTEGTYEVGPEGTAATKARYYVNAIVESRGAPLNRADVTTMSITFHYSGAITAGTY